MCGISAIVDHDRDGSAALRALSRMHDAMRHRGPDGEGHLLADADGRVELTYRAPADVQGAVRCGLAFRHLKIQDLTDAGRQPMVSPDGRRWIVLNGEIYNHRELRAELEAMGHRFRGSSDTEVALAAWLAWGDDCFGRFNGMWALLLLDLDRRRLIGSRDRLGIKPLFHATDGPRLLLASEPQAIVRARRVGPAIEPRRFSEFLRGMPPQSAALSFFREVHPVPAGTVFSVDLDAPVAPLTFRRFWDLADCARADPHLPFERARDGLHALLDASVRWQQQAAVPVGCLLSGGIDSSTVAAVLARQRREERVPAFSIVYDDPQMSEAPYVLAVAGHAGLRSVRHTLSPAEAWEAVDRVVATQGQPLLGQEVIAQDRAYALAREHGAIVVLEGQGADELFAGMPLYERAYLRELVLGARFRELGRELAHRRARYGLSRLETLRRYVASPVMHGLSPRGGTYDWVVAPPPGDDGPGVTSADPSLLNRYLFGLVRHTNLPVVLLYQDRSAMAHGVESRVPYLDHRIVELAFRMPAAHKAGGDRKQVLRAVAREYLPPLVLNRTDKKTLVSRAGWMPLRAHAHALRDMAADGALRACPYLRPAAVERFVGDYLGARHDDAPAVWRLYTAWRWLRAFGAT